MAISVTFAFWPYGQQQFGTCSTFNQTLFPIKDTKVRRKCICGNLILKQLDSKWKKIFFYSKLTRTGLPPSLLSSLFLTPHFSKAVLQQSLQCSFFQLICNQTPRFTIGDCAAGHRADNRDKNRNVLIVPRKCLFVFVCFSSLFHISKQTNSWLKL